MEKVRFEAFNVEELRVLRRACYEAGAAFGDPGHTAAERATLDDLAEWKDVEAAIRELHARQPEMERLYLDGKILPGELQALVMVSNCLEREFTGSLQQDGRCT